MNSYSEAWRRQRAKERSAGNTKRCELARPGCHGNAYRIAGDRWSCSNCYPWRMTADEAERAQTARLEAMKRMGRAR